MDKLNSQCPFFDRSTKYFSNLGMAPDVLESKQANLTILEVLNLLADRVKSESINWSPIALSEYDNIARKSNEMSNHTP